MGDWDGVGQGGQGGLEREEGWVKGWVGMGW